jgi:hypothetical protein
MLDTPWLASPWLMLVCLEAGHLLGRRPGDALEELTVIQDLESVLVDQDHDAFAGMAQADLEPRAAELDLAALADDALNGRLAQRPARAAGRPPGRLATGVAARPGPGTAAS